MNNINLIVFSLTTPVSLLVEAIEATKQNEFHTLCLSPHKLFDTEIACITKKTSKKISFSSFYEFISQKEMEYCDTEADNIIISEKKSRENQLRNYYSKIKELKNIIIIDNISAKYQLELKYILSDDLGIDVQVWLRNGFNNCFLPLPESTKITIYDKVTRRVKVLFQYLKNKPVISLFRTSAENFYLI